ncbi:MAG: hypothetical protein OXL33_04130 [Chloroflexota bacterium]|nr:hypothetical protein [Chloroflexota bacterium]MXY12871.1 hypothetical protein [Chloroflexota bacterium]MYB15527.1 hypothetical protein [Chloroflexota bacterium]MYC47126.1 hypothetical protein [Chloroflexota bacterium]
MTSHPDAGRSRRHANLRSGLGMGLLAGVTAIMCCVSPVLMVLLGVLTAVEAISLGDTLYYEYGWYFRGAGLLVAALAVLIYLRRRNSCSLGGARRHWIALATLPVTAVITYVALFWLTKYLGIWFG